MTCAVALVLLLDASGSIAPDVWDQQRDSTADAIEHPAIVRLIEGGDGVAATALAFDDAIRPLVEWHVLRDWRDAVAFSVRLRQAPRGLPGGTDIGAALTAGLAAFSSAPCAADQLVIDIVTDGEAPIGPAQAARDAAIVAGVRINGLGVGGSGDDPAAWLRDHAITPDGFVVAARDWHDFAGAMRRKLSMEVASR